MDYQTDREKGLMTKFIVFLTTTIMLLGFAGYLMWTIYDMRIAAVNAEIVHDVKQQDLKDHIESQDELIEYQAAQIQSLEEQSVFLLALDPLAGLIDDMDIHALIEEIPRGNPFNAVPQVTSSFGESTGFYPRATHRGTDMIPKNPETADWSIKAYAPGVVVGYGVDYIYGKYIVVEHTPNIRTKYAHLGKIYFTGVTGKEVTEDTIIGVMGSTGRSTRAHLHFEIQVRVNDDTWIPIDADPFLNRETK